MLKDGPLKFVESYPEEQNRGRLPPRPAALAVRTTVPPEAPAVTRAFWSLLIADARFAAMLVGVVPEPDHLVLSPNPDTVIVVVPES
jgi:hypothetical protein